MNLLPQVKTQLLLLVQALGVAQLALLVLLVKKIPTLC